MPRGSSRRDPVKPHTSRTRIRITLGALFITAMAAMNYCAVRELLLVLVLLAGATLVIFGFSVILILIQEGLLWTSLWTRTGVLRIVAFARLSPEAPGSGKK